VNRAERNFTTSQVLAVVLPIHLVGAVAAWRDLDRRAVGDVRGSKRVWRVACCLNVLGWVAYFLFGRISKEFVAPREDLDGIPDPEAVVDRADGRPPEEASSDDPMAQAQAILEESEERIADAAAGSEPTTESVTPT
jgi:hypothetical protein